MKSFVGCASRTLNKSAALEMVRDAHPTLLDEIERERVKAAAELRGYLEGLGYV